MTDVCPVNLPATKEWPVSVDNLPGDDPLVIHPRGGRVILTLPWKGWLGQVRTIKCADAAINHVYVRLDFGRSAHIYPGGKVTFESRRVWWSILGELLYAQPRLRWVVIG